LVHYNTPILKFKEQGEKAGWTYIEVPANVAEKLKPGCKKSFRVKGKLDNHPIEQVALMPMGGGDFIMALNASMRKGIRKTKDALLKVQLEEDLRPIELNSDFMDCLHDAPDALAFFKTLPKSHQTYFSKWIDGAKTDATKAKRITLAVNALALKRHFGQMMRAMKKEKDRLL
jgi:hypothetical protein